MGDHSDDDMEVCEDSKFFRSDLATPLVEKDSKLFGKISKLLKSASKVKKSIRHGIPECTKSIRKGQKG